MKNWLFVLLILFTHQISAQKTQDDELKDALLNFKIIQNSFDMDDNIAYEKFIEKLEYALSESKDLSEFTKFNDALDSLDMVMNRFSSEDKSLLVYHLSDGFDHWNYILKNREIILKENKSHEYFTEIHLLNDKEFLLIEQRDDLVFSCSYAYVFEENSNGYLRKKAFEKREKLSICNFTNLEESIAITSASDNETLPISESYHYSVPARKITFNAATQMLDYGICYNYFTQKTHTGKAKYKNGKFKIKDCDERLFYD